MILMLTTNAIYLVLYNLLEQQRLSSTMQDEA